MIGLCLFGAFLSESTRFTQALLIPYFFGFNILHSERPKLYTLLAFLSAIGLRQGFPFQNNLKDLEPSCQMDLDLWDCFERRKKNIVIWI